MNDTTPRTISSDVHATRVTTIVAGGIEYDLIQLTAPKRTRRAAYADWCDQRGVHPISIERTGSFGDVSVYTATVER